MLARAALLLPSAANPYSTGVVLPDLSHPREGRMWALIITESTRCTSFPRASMPKIGCDNFRASPNYSVSDATPSRGHRAPGHIACALWLEDFEVQSLSTSRGRGDLGSRGTH
ncbi:hypothetical protein B0H14DRAFT_3449877 [Mycena olivaceomarginata]|nr:hypothetical protein B0H14DRAFT_3449877 [Mycena olivaceomarginata]